VFAGGTGAIIINDINNGMISHVGIAFAFGLVLMTMIYAVGDISGAHINPVVSFGFWLAGRLPLRELPGYFLSQITGASMNPARH